MDPPPPRPAAVPLSHARTTRRGHGVLGKDEAPSRGVLVPMFGGKKRNSALGNDHEARAGLPRATSQDYGKV